MSVRGRPRTLSVADVDRAAAWRAERVSAVAISRRLGVADTTVHRALAATPSTATAGQASDDDQPPLEPGSEPRVPGCGEADRADAGTSAPAPESGAEPVVASDRLGQAVVSSRYAGAMLLHAFFDRVGAEAVFAPLGAPGRPRVVDAALLTATTCAFALGVSSVEATKHLVRTQVGPLTGIAALPTLRILRSRLASLAESTDALALQAKLAAGMIDSESPRPRPIDDGPGPTRPAHPNTQGTPAPPRANRASTCPHLPLP